MSLHIKKRGRPSKEAVAARTATITTRKRTDAEVLADLRERFAMLAKLTTGALRSNIRSMVVVGAAGVGKTHTVEQVLEGTEGAQFSIVKGAISAVSLYKLGYANRAAGNVIVLDDADSIFTDEDALNILKALCDSSTTRRVSWMKESVALANDDVPQSYEFHGAFIFISNLDFQRYVDMGGNKYVTHFTALMSRSLYLDLRLHDTQAIGLWVREVATTGRLFEREGITPAVGEKILNFILGRRDDLRELSIRTLVKACSLARSHPAEWERMAAVLLLR